MFPHSIRWRLQIWLGILLVGLLAAFGVVAWQMEKAQRVGRLDEELKQRAAALGVAVRGGGGGGGRSEPPDFRPGPDDDFAPGGRPSRPPSKPPRERSGRGRPPDDFFGDGDFDDAPLDPGSPRPIPEEVEKLFRDFKAEGYYYAMWTGPSKRIQRSDLAPREIPLPKREERDTQTRFRNRDGMREAYHFTELGECVLAGRPLGSDLEGMRPFALRLALSGLGILALGLGGGWWLTTRSIRPIEQIAGTARRISEGNLAERIPVDHPGSELGQLATVLNTTFARLEDSFAQQKRFTADASHELRTPLSVLIAETQGALSRDRSAEDYREALAGNLETARQMKRLAEALLELARLDAGEDGIAPVPVDLSDVAARVIGRLQPLAEQKVVTLQCEGDSVSVEGSPERMALVISNLVENAIHHGRAGGSVVVKVRTQGAEAIVSVADDGPGIAADDLPHVFERFYRADKSRTGSDGRYGLGLAICRGLLEADGGRIGASSPPGQGATFTITLPLRKNPQG